MTTRLEQSIVIMKKLCGELHISKYDPGMKELSRRLSEYCKHEKIWAGYIELVSIKGHLHVILPSNPAMEIRVILKAID